MYVCLSELVSNVYYGNMFPTVFLNETEIIVGRIHNIYFNTLQQLIKKRNLKKILNITDWTEINLN